MAIRTPTGRLPCPLPLPANAAPSSLPLFPAQGHHGQDALRPRPRHHSGALPAALHRAFVATEAHDLASILIKPHVAMVLVGWSHPHRHRATPSSSLPATSTPEDTFIVTTFAAMDDLRTASWMNPAQSLHASNSLALASPQRLVSLRCPQRSFFSLCPPSKRMFHVSSALAMDASVTPPLSMEP
jgi:hypothetical protein